REASGRTSYLGPLHEPRRPGAGSPGGRLEACPTLDGACPAVHGFCARTRTWNSLDNLAWVFLLWLSVALNLPAQGGKAGSPAAGVATVIGLQGIVEVQRAAA